MRHFGVSLMAFSAMALSLSPAWAGPAQAGSDPSTGTSNVFDLGEMIILGKRPIQLQIDTSILPAIEIEKFNRNSLDDAIKLIPGASASNTGGSRNERVINVRGFDRFQVPLSIDGIRVYLPADNRLDFGRFMTADVSEIQVVKGYVSVLDGPGALGGAVNLVSRKPTKNLEAEARIGFNLDNGASYGGMTSFASVGTKQEKYYLQATGSWTDRDHWSLSKDFTPTANEDGGDRDHSNSRDWKVTAKAGFTPNDRDEYSLNFLKQSGVKDAPYHVTDPIASQRYWRWPYWDVASLYWLSDTHLNDGITLKTRLYYNKLQNSLDSYDDRNYTKQTLPKAFNSRYDDTAYGGSVELAAKILPTDTLKGAFHYRRDKHIENQQVFPSGFTEPDQTTIEDTFSLAAENTFHPIEAVDLVAGLSYDWRNLTRAEDWTGATAAGNFIHYPLKNSHAWNWQGAAVYHYSDSGKVYASLSSRTRFPTIFERFSTQFGTSVPNPDLKPERALNAEIGAADRILNNVQLNGAVFYSDLKDVIVSILAAGPSGTLQRQNVGDGTYYGFEFSFMAPLSSAVDVGGNYTYTHRKISNPINPILQLTDVPDHKAFLYVDIRPFEKLTLTPSVEIASDRWSSNTNATIYYQGGAYTLANLNLQYQPVEAVTLSAGVRNFFDENYALAYGFPEEGRNFFVTAKFTY